MLTTSETSQTRLITVSVNSHILDTDRFRNLEVIGTPNKSDNDDERVEATKNVGAASKALTAEEWRRVMSTKKSLK